MRLLSFSWFQKKDKTQELLKNRREIVRKNDNQVKQFRKALLLHGLGIRTVEEDGNCLFRAVSDQLYGSEDYHEHVRKKVCDYMQSHSDFFGNFLTGERSVAQYIQDMRKDGSWAGNIEVSIHSFSSQLSQMFALVASSFSGLSREYSDSPTGRALV